jgi:(p)ppGpp synthase/HD superfamily hydrolase
MKENGQKSSKLEQKPIDMTSKALELATICHKGQTRRNGDPYITHPMRVAKKFTDPEEISVALMHDVLEDTNCMEIDLRKAGFSFTVIEAVKALTRNMYALNETYFDFIFRLKQNEIAKKVKIADLEDNMSDLEEGTLKDKYRFAHFILTQV